VKIHHRNRYRKAYVFAELINRQRDAEYASWPHESDQKNDKTDDVDSARTLPLRKYSSFMLSWLLRSVNVVHLDDFLHPCSSFSDMWGLKLQVPCHEISFGIEARHSRHVKTHEGTKTNISEGLMSTIIKWIYGALGYVRRWFLEIWCRLRTTTRPYGHDYKGGRLVVESN